MVLSLIPEAEMPPDVDARIREGLCRCFPPDVEIFSQTRAWHGCAPAWSVVLRDGEVIAAHVGIVDRTILAGGERVRVAGVQNVYSLPEYRGAGLGRRVLAAAMVEAGRLGMDGGLLFCTHRLERYYAADGWQTVPVRSVTRVEDGRDLPLPGKNITMYLPLARPALPGLDIHLQGNDW